mmetsp:Transcript_28096/g.34086  ORF Transcript_28096/g.34086 Transcript_28096/m.34086 type:complete len:182 (-) Transcript_28096:41-586(-)
MSHFLAPGSAQHLDQWFRSVDRDGTNKISVKELQQVLAHHGLNFSLKFTMSLINLYDRDRSGTLCYQEFQCIHQFLSHVSQTFHQFAHQDPQMGKPVLDLPGAEHALKQIKPDSNLDQTAFYQVCKSFDVERNGKLTEDQFIGLNVFITGARNVFASFDQQRSGSVTLTLDQFVWATASCT